MLIQNYGLFWKNNEIDWFPGKGNREAFRLLGRRGAKSDTLELADFRDQQGIYILYGNYGAVYVGLTRSQGLGKRLQDHLGDEWADKWDRFSWFGFRDLLKADKATGLRALRALPEIQLGEPLKAIGDIEALLIKAMGTQNVRKMNFQRADEWMQVEDNKVLKFLQMARGE